ncbi:MAG: hypothetical protein AAF386_09425 [Pseudomonadota bacterium]
MTKRPEPQKSTPGRRRRVDAAIVLPMIGAVLVFVPVLWPRAASGPTVQTSSAAIYLFGVWAAMILGAMVVAYLLRPGPPGAQNDD